MGCNDSQAKDPGFACEAEAIGKNILDLHSAMDSNQYISNDEEVMRTGIAKTYSETETLDNGVIIFYTTHKSPLKNEKNKVMGVMGMSVAINPTTTLTENLNLLSPQQLKCFQLLIKGFSLKQIAFEMNLTYKTVEYYVTHIRKKLNCRNTRELIVRYANH